MRDSSPERVADILLRLGLKGIRIKRNRVVALCPFHAERSASFAVMCGWEGRQPRYVCLGCGASGSILGLFWRLHRVLPENEVLPMEVELVLPDGGLWGEKHDLMQRYEYVPNGERAARVKYMDLAPVVGGRGEVRGEVREVGFAPLIVVREEDLERFSAKPPEYIIERGIGLETLGEYGIRDDVHGRRVIFPIRDWSGALRGWSARTYWRLPICLRCSADLEEGAKECVRCGANLAKYLHTKGLDRNNIVYGEAQYEVGTVPLFVEGFMDVLRPVEHGIRAVATPLGVMGASIGEMQVRRVLRQISPSLPVGVMGDNDKAGRMLNESFCKMVRGMEVHRRVVEVRLPDGVKDPGEMTVELVGELVRRLRLFVGGSEQSGVILL